MASSSSSELSVGDTLDGHSIQSSLSGDVRLNDHRNQSMSLPVRTDSRLMQQAHQHQAEYHNDEESSVGQRRLSNKSQRSKASIKSLKDAHRVKPSSPKLTAHKRHRVKARTSSFGSNSVHSNDKLRDGPLPVPINPLLNSTALRSKMLATDDNGDEDEYATKFQDRYSRVASGGVSGRGMSRRRSRSVDEQAQMLMMSAEEAGKGILLPANSQHENLSRPTSHNGVTILDNGITKTVSKVSSSNSRRRRDSNTSDSSVDSHGSRDSQETEEDVCFPMVPKHVRVRGIDFDEIEEFITEQRLENEEIVKRENELRLQMSGSMTTSAEKFSTAALRYTPKKGSSSPSDVSSKSAESPVEEKVDSGSIYSEESYHPGDSDTGSSSGIPDRFSFFNSMNEETIHGPDIPSLFEEGQPVRSSFEPEDSIWWLDCTCPTDEEMKVLAKAFGIHPLTAEDIRMQETREKVEMFRNYYFVCFHTFETDSESEDFLEPINVYIVVFRQGMLTVHFSAITNPANVRRRVRQLKDYVDMSADWLCYAMIDDITDGFAPVIHSIEYEADAIEDSVFLSRENDFRGMLLRIGESRRKVMTLMRLLQGKADVIKMFAKRCQDEAGLVAAVAGSGQAAQPRADIALYLGDIQDHIITMFQSLLSYEKIFSRSHSNYLAQLQVESFYSNNQVTDMLSKVTMIGTILVPMNLVTGLFGMNVHVPGQDGSNYAWFCGILGFIIFVVIISGFTANYYMGWVQRKNSSLGGIGGNAGVSMKSFGFGKRKDNNDRRTTRTANSLPSRFTRYGDWS